MRLPPIYEGFFIENNYKMEEGDMKKNATRQVKLSQHAHIRYCQRVRMITWEELNQIVQRHFADKQYVTDKKKFVCFDDTWWSYRIAKEKMVLTTCYGKSDYDVPAALSWAAVHQDSIRLGNWAERNIMAEVAKDG